MKIQNSKGRSKGSGYSRLFNNNEIGRLLSKVQATVISNGNELERLLLERTQNITDLNRFIQSVETDDGTVADGVYVCSKKVLKKSSYASGIEPDLLIFIVQKRRVCKVIELKDGDSFDTKKSAGEKEHLENFSKEFGCKVPFTTEYYICCFNQPDKEQIFKGFKSQFAMEHILTGEELCEILGINYREILRIRERDAQDNREYFARELLKIRFIANAAKDKFAKKGE